MKIWKKVLLVGIIALVITLSGSGIAAASDSKSGVKDDYHVRVYYELMKHGGRKWIKPIPNLADDQFGTYIDAYNYVIGLVASGYAYDTEVWNKEDYWAKSNQTDARMEGDCDDWAIYLVSLLTYHTEQPTNAWVACGLVSVPEDGAGLDGNAPRPYDGGHFWVVIPVGGDIWMVLDPVYPDVAADNPFVVKQYIPDLDGEFYVNAAFLEIFRFNTEQAMGYVEALLAASAYPVDTYVEKKKKQ